jgi:hypothetical protein
MPSAVVVERFSHSLQASSSEDVQMEQPVLYRYASAFDCHATLAGVLDPTLVPNVGRSIY